MTFRIEFGRSRSDAYAWAVRLAKRLPTYQERTEHGVLVHSIEFDDIETFVPLQRAVGGWKTVAYFIDGHPAGADQLWSIYYEKHPYNFELPRQTKTERDVKRAVSPADLLRRLNDEI